MSITDSPSSQLAPHREGHAFDLVGGASSRSGPPVHPAPPAATPFAYLAYVDGLRAIAVIAVVLYHAHIPGFGGGFLGVDVFFVISGYLITGLLWKELQTTGRVSMVAFYARRARRLLPALAATLTLTSAAAVVLLLPDPELRWFGQSVLASATFTSNVFFFLKTNGYFGAEAELQPLLHTWSLAVEEQFYIVWPLLLLASVKLGRWRTRDLRKTVRAVTLATVIASLLLALVLERSNPSMAFFLAPSRFWELGVGAFLALGTGSRPALARIPLASVGMLLVLGVIAAAPVLPLSGAPLTLLAVLGTALTLLGAANAPQGRTASFLSIPALVWTGKHSYSWYLLHWPALVLVRVTTMEASAVRDFAIALLTLALAAVFVKVIEGPFRQPASAGTPRHGRTLLVAGVVSVVMAIAGLVGSIRSDTIARIELTASERSALVENRTARNSCPNQPGAAPAVDCAFSATGIAITEADRNQTRIVLTGDSHALALLPAVRALASEAGLPLEVLWDTGCPYLGRAPAGIQVSESCRLENEARSERLREVAASTALLVITGRHTSYLVPERSTPADHRSWEQSIIDDLAPVQAEGVPILVVHDVPRFEHPAPACSVRNISACALSLDAASAYREAVQASETEAARALAAHTWDPFAELCATGDCPVAHDGIVLYRDRDHLSIAGARHISPSFVQWALPLVRKLDAP